MVWLLAELARGPWDRLSLGRRGYAREGPLAALARSVGVYGIGFAAAVLAMLLVQVRRSDLRNPRVWALALGVLVLAGGAALQRHCAVEQCQTPTAPAAPALPLVLLRGNIPQDEKFQPGGGCPWRCSGMANG